MPASSPRSADNPSLAILGAAIRRLRLERGWSQEAFADIAVLDRSYMGSIERGKQNPGIATVLNIASALGITATELFAEAGL